MECLKKKCECELRLEGRRASSHTERTEIRGEGGEGVDREAGEESGGLQTLESENHRIKQLWQLDPASGPKSRSR